jgi:polysaccharide export outer membrane protein
MTSILLSKQVHRRRIVSIASALAAILALQLGGAGLTAAQSPAPQAYQAYRIAAGDKIGVTVFGQPELSGEATVDQSGNLRLPILGDIRAVNLTPSELEKRIAYTFGQGYLRNPAVSVKIAEYRPIYVLGLVRNAGLYPYRQGLSVLGAIARAGGIGVSEGRQGNLLGELLQAEERVRLLEINRVALTTRQARLTAQQNNEDKIDFPDMSGNAVDSARMAQIIDNERRAFNSEKQAERQETEALQNQLPRLQAEIASLKQQQALEQQQRDLNHQLISDYEKLMKTGLTRKPNYIEVKREEARISENIERLRSDTLKAELAIGDIKFRISELHNNYRRRVMTELRETKRSLLELSVTLPSAQRTRAVRAQQIGMLSAEEAQQPSLTVIRARNSTLVKLDAAADFMLEPGDVVQVGSLFPPPMDMLLKKIGAPEAKKAQSDAPSPIDAAAAAQRAAVQPARTLN